MLESERHFKKHKQIIFASIFFESFLLAWHSIKVNRLRAALTLFGLSIGIFCIVTVFAAVDALEKGVRENIASLGSDVLYIQKWPWEFTSDYKWWEYMKRPVPKYIDYEIIIRKAQTVDVGAFSVSTRRNIKYKKTTFENGGIWANTYDFIKIRTFEIEDGRYFSPMEDKTGQNKCLIGSNVRKNLFGSENPIGKFIEIEGRKIEVIGIIKKEGTGLFGGSLDDLVLLPLNFARHIFDIRNDNLNPFIMIKAKPDVPLEQMKAEVKNILRRMHALKPNQPDDFSLNQASMVISGINQIFNIINLAGWIIGGFSILVGGFGIANIMFVGVKERTNQIGIQKAIGAKNVFILSQFLFEGVILAIAGGLVGIIIVLFALLIANNLLDFSVSFTLSNFIFGITVSAIVGIVSAIWPAYSASRLNPVEAINTTF